MSVIVEKIASALMIPESAIAPSLGTPGQIIASSVTKTGSYHEIVSSDLNGLGDDCVFDILEALDGDCKGQLVMILAFHEGSDTAACTPLQETAPTTTTFRRWVTGLKKATATSDSANTTSITSTYRTETDADYWPRFRMLGMYDLGVEGQKNISAFDTALDKFTTEAWSSTPQQGWPFLPCQPLKPAEVDYGISTTAIPRENIQDTLDGDGVVPGAQVEAQASFSPEIRGLETAAGNGTEADPPGEMHEALRAVMTEVLNTGDTAQAGSSTSNPIVSDGTRFTQYSLALHELGDVFAISGISGNTLTVPSGHLGTIDTADVIYGGACYQPKDTSHESISMLFFHGRQLMTLLLGGMPELKGTIENDALGRYQFAYQFVGGLVSDLAQGHDDTYDNSTPVVGKSNVNRVLIDGSEVEAQILNAEMTLLDAPQKKGMAFGGFENNGGMIYSGRNAGISMTMQLEDSTYFNRFRKGDTFDFLIQAGRIPTAAWGLWAPRAQVMNYPEKGSGDGLLQQTLVLGFLRPTTAGQPAFVVGHF